MENPKVQRARPDEREALIELFNTAFRVNNPQHPDFALMAPELYHPSNYRAEDHLVIRDGDRPVAAVGLFPLQFAAGPNVMDVAGIGQVCTLPGYRGRGYMTALMKAAEAEVDARGFVLGYLGGDRARYARYGWEATEYYWRFHLTAKYLADFDQSGWGFEVPQRFEPWMHEAIEAKPFRRTMTYEVMRWAVRRAGCHMLVGHGPAGRAIVVHGTDEQVEIRDWGGPAEAILALIVELARRSKTGSVFINTPACRADLAALLRRYATRCHPQAGANLRICRLAEILKAYLPWLSRAPHVCSDGLTLRMTDAQQSATLVLGDDADVVDAPGRHELSLSRLEMAAFLFGPFPPSRVFDLPPELAGLDAVFPLPVFVSGISTV